MNWITIRLERLANVLQPAKARMGQVTMFFGVAMVTVGFPAQIYANWRDQTCGIDIVLITFALLLYLVRLPYQISARAWYLLPADVVGLAASVILVIQWFIY